MKQAFEMTLVLLTFFFFQLGVRASGAEPAIADRIPYPSSTADVALVEASCTSQTVATDDCVTNVFTIEHVYSGNSAHIGETFSILSAGAQASGRVYRLCPTPKIGQCGIWLVAIHKGRLIQVRLNTIPWFSCMEDADRYEEAKTLAAKIEVYDKEKNERTHDLLLRNVGSQTEEIADWSLAMIACHFPTDFSNDVQSILTGAKMSVQEEVSVDREMTNLDRTTWLPSASRKAMLSHWAACKPSNYEVRSLTSHLVSEAQQRFGASDSELIPTCVAVSANKNLPILDRIQSVRAIGFLRTLYEVPTASTALQLIASSTDERKLKAEAQAWLAKGHENLDAATVPVEEVKTDGDN